MTSAWVFKIAQLASWDSRMMVEKPVRKSEVLHLLHDAVERRADHLDGDWVGGLGHVWSVGIVWNGVLRLRFATLRTNG